MYYASTEMIHFTKSDGFSWWRQLHPYELYIRTMEDPESTGFINRLEVIGLTRKNNRTNDEVLFQRFQLDRILRFIELNDLEDMNCGSRKCPDLRLYIDMAKGCDHERLATLQQLILKQKRQLILEQDAGVSLENVLISAEMKVCKKQPWAQEIELPVTDQAEVEVFSIHDDMETDRYTEYTISCRGIRGVYFDIDTDDNTLLRYIAEKRLRALCNKEFDIAFLNSEEDHIDQFMRFIVYDSIQRGEKAIKSRQLKGPEILCFQTQKVYHWGVFLPDGTHISKDRIYEIMDAADFDTEPSGTG